MGAPIDYFVDPGSGTDDMPGGTVGDPWATIQYALDTGITRDATHGDQINVKAGTDDTLGAALSLATYGTPVESAPLIIRGYTSVADDGGIGGIDGDGTYAIIGSTGDIHFIDMHLHNCGAATIVTLGTGSTIQQCQVDTTTGTAIALATAQAINCNVHTFGGTGITANTSYVYGNYINDASATAAISMGPNAVVTRNIITVAGTTDGIQMPFDGGMAVHNSILSSSGTGQGIIRTANRYLGHVMNNLIEGFSGSGGVGIDLGSLSENVVFYGGNAVYEDGAGVPYSIASADFVHNYGDNETLGASPFDKSGSNTYANRFTYFGPVDTGNVHGGAYPSANNLDKGAVQHADSGGGGVPGNISGGLQ